MTTTEQLSRCERFLDDLAGVIDGDQAILEQHLDHLAECDECRDVRHDAAAARSALRAAGDDYVVPADMEERVVRALGTNPAIVPEPSTSPSTSTSPTPTPTPIPSPIPIPSTSTSTSTRTRRTAWIAGGLSAAAAVTLFAVVKNSSSQDTITASPDAAAWSAQIAVVDRAAADASKTGVTVSDSSGAMIPGAAETRLAPGATLRTDESTRVELRMSDGTIVHLDHATAIRIGDDGRALTLSTGNLVADVAHDEASRATFATPAGTVEVLGTRFALSATSDHTSVRVVRGAVRLVSAKGAVEVRAGEEGTTERDARPEVAAATDLVGAVGWSELLDPVEPADELPAGIGELRAYKPGEKRDRDWQLSLARHKVTVRIAGNVARTEIEETFQNDSAAVLEGVYKFPLPADARVERLALDVDGKMEEGAFVAKDRAAKIWRGVIQKAAPRPQIAQDEIIWVPGPWRDPALLEWQQGGRFELRIFPIPAKGARTIQLAYTQVLSPQASERRYVYPLPHRADRKAGVGQFDVDIRLAGADPAREPRVHNYDLARAAEGDAFRYTMSARDFHPRGDLIVDFVQPDRGAELRAWSFLGDAAAAPTLAASKKGGADPAVVEAQKVVAADRRATALVALRPKLPRWTESRQRDYVLVVDSSQSMVGERFARARRLASALIGEMDRRDRFALLACDVDCRSLGDEAQAPSAAAAKRAADWMGEVDAAGASDVVTALDRAAHFLDRSRVKDRDVWVIYIGDGMASTGYRRLADVRAEAGRLADAADVSFSTVGIGGDSDTTSLAAVARAGGGHFSPYVPGQRAELAALSVLETTFGVALERPIVVLPDGLEDASPAELPTLRAGQELYVAARFTGKVSGDVVLRGTVGGKPYENRFPLALEASEKRGNAFVPRMWAALTIEKLELEGRGEDQARIVALSQAYSVLSRHTSLLVLESPAMFRAFGVDRARAAVEWTGDEEGEETGSDGKVDYQAAAKQANARRPMKVAGRAGWGAGAASGRGADTMSLDEGGMGGGGEAMPAPAPEPAEAAEKEDRVDTRTEAKKKAPSRELASRPMPRDGRRWVQMRREWYRVGSVGTFDGVHPKILDAVARADAALRIEPNSRERHRALVQALAYAGDLPRAHEMAARWLERDRLDADALGTMADVLGRMGRRGEAIRVLSGVADLSPDDRALHARLAAAYDRIGATERACSHRIAAAALSLADVEVVARAIRCQRATGRSTAADRLLASLTDAAARSKAETLAALPPAGERARGDLLLDARWDGAVDLDISLVTPDGKRVSWMGGKRGVTAEDAGQVGSERVAVRRIAAGNYLVEIARTDVNDRTPARGQVTVEVLGQKRTLTFDLTAERAVVGRVAVQRKSRLVPI